MGWYHHDDDEHGEHEGYVVAYVPREWVAAASATELGSGRPVATVVDSLSNKGPFRELGVQPLDHEHVIRGFVFVGAACVCGWRSPRRSGTAEWSPSCVEGSEAMDDRLAELWRAHVEHELARFKRR